MATAQASRSVRKKIESMSSRDLKKQQPWKLFLTGDEGSGKTHFTLTFMTYAYYELGLDIDECLMVFIDPDVGVGKLLEAGVIPENLQDRITHFIPNTWQSLMEATDKAYDLIDAHIKKYGDRGRLGSIIVVENRGTCWQWAQNDYAEGIYGKTMVEKAEDAKKLARDLEKKTMPTLDRMLDYGVINPKYNSWAEGMKNSGYNFIWTAWLKEVTIQEGGGKEKIVVRKCQGQKADPGRTDITLLFHVNGSKYLVDLEKRRGLTSRFADQENVDFTTFVSHYKILQKGDRKRREDYFSKLEEKRRKVLGAKEPKKVEETPTDGVPVEEPKPGTESVVEESTTEKKDETDLSDWDFTSEEA